MGNKGKILIEHKLDGNWLITSDYIFGLLLWGPELIPLLNDLPNVIKKLNELNKLGVEFKDHALQPDE